MDKLPERKIKSENKVYKWLDNYWYHYKWPTLIVCFFLVFFMVVGFQMCGKENTDMYIMYAGPYVFEGTDELDMDAAFNGVMSCDFNGDGIKNTQLVKLYILSEEQIEAQNKEDIENGFEVYDNTYFFSQEMEKFNKLILAGEYSICMLDPSLYQSVLASGGFLELSAIFDEVPPSAIDDYGIKLSETEFGKYFSSIAKLPEDTVLCIRRETTFSFLKPKKTAEQYEYYLQMFKDIVNFSVDN